MLRHTLVFGLGCLAGQLGGVTQIMDKHMVDIIMIRASGIPMIMDPPYT